MLAPLFSLPGSHGIGDIDSLQELIEEVGNHGVSLIQVLPLNTLAGSETSPYSSISAFANHPLYISLKKIPFLKDLPDSLPSKDRVDYQKAYQTKMPALKQAYENFLAGANGSVKTNFDAFCDAQKDWLQPYSMFHYLFDTYHRAFWDWDEIHLRPEDAMVFAQEHQEEIGFYQFLQWVFFQQWKELREVAGEWNIQLIGDLPLYVSKNSADAWSGPDSFQKGIHAGVPPDLYSEDGQDWGNPIYDWEKMQKDGYSWWKARMLWLKEFVDIVRIDHFRGIYSYWAVEDSKSPKDTTDWTPGPASHLIAALKETGIEMIGEDLGYIPEEVEDWLEEMKVPGFRVLIFGYGFYSRVPEYGAHRHRDPDQYPAQSLACTTTHDSESLMEFLEEIQGEERSALVEYLDASQEASAEELRMLCIQKILHSPGIYKVFPLQDVLGMAVRINLPGSVSEKNWSSVFHWKNYQRQLDEFYGLIRSLG